MSFPPLPTDLTYDAVYERLVIVRHHLPPTTDDSDEANVDVRLVVGDDGAWCVNTGDVGYDAHHRAWCGASVITALATDDELREVAIDLLDQVESEAELFLNEDHDETPDPEVAREERRRCAECGTPVADHGYGCEPVPSDCPTHLDSGAPRREDGES